MIISSFYRIRFFRWDKSSLVLKLWLPLFRAEISGEEASCDKLNSFYSAIYEAYSDALSKIVSLREDRIRISVNFLIATDKHLNKYKRLFKKVKNPLVIERYINSSAPLEISGQRHLDIFDIDRGILIK